MRARRKLESVFSRLLKAYGPQHWWPGDGPFEIMVGAILTQNTAWSNVEKAIGCLKSEGLLDAGAIVAASQEKLAACLRSSGYFNIKAARLVNFCQWYVSSGGMKALQRKETAPLRRELLAVKGVGPETADDMLLYALARPVFVIDAYTRRIFSRYGLVAGDEGYEELRAFFESSLAPDVALFNEYHALIVRHGKDICRPRPLCDACCLRRGCARSL